MIPVYCNQCVAGPDLMRVQVENGVATRIESNYSIKEAHPGGGRVCVKAYGLIQKTFFLPAARLTGYRSMLDELAREGVYCRADAAVRK